MTVWKSIETVKEIRERRLEEAERALIKAKEAHLVAQDEVIRAQQELIEYEVMVPTLIDDLYSSCMNLAVGKAIVEDVRAKENKIRMKVLALRDSMLECQSHEKAMALQVEEAQALQAKEYIGVQTLEELQEGLKKEERLATKRYESKELDEFAGRRHCLK